MKRPDPATIGLTTVAALAALALVIGLAPHGSDAPAPTTSTTIPLCDVYATTSTPDLPANTRADVCAAQTDTGAWYVDTPTGNSPAAP